MGPPPPPPKKKKKNDRALRDLGVEGRDREKYRIFYKFSPKKGRYIGGGVAYVYIYIYMCIYIYITPRTPYECLSSSPEAQALVPNIGGDGGTRRQLSLHVGLRAQQGLGLLEVDRT